jgi:phosphoribosylformylglycinamidine cyclo-ligase
MTVGQALLSPTRTYAPVLRPLLRDHRAAIAGLVHCSGGGQTKCLRFGRGVHFAKDNLFPPPPIFRALARATGATAHELHRVYNLGHRMEVYCASEHSAAVIAAAQAHGIAARVVGRTEPTRRPDGANHVTIRAAGETLEYAL